MEESQTTDKTREAKPARWCEAKEVVITVRGCQPLLCSRGLLTCQVHEDQYLSCLLIYTCVLYTCAVHVCCTHVCLYTNIFTHKKMDSLDHACRSHTARDLQKTNPRKEVWKNKSTRSLQRA